MKENDGKGGQTEDMKRIETERLILDKWTTSEADIKGLYEYAKNPDVGPNAGWKPHDSEAESKEIIEELFLPNEVWAIREKESGKIIGSVGLEPDKRRENVNSWELGYSLAKESWGMGYMTEAAKAVIDYAFKELDLVVLAICTGPENKRSQRVIEKCGFKFEGVQRKAYHTYDGADRDNLVYSMLREEWEALKDK